MVSINKCQAILKTLPIGFYLGRAIECEMNEGDNSYFDPMEDKIVIGYQMLPIDKLKEDDPELEDNIRCMLYHEISHVLLTPSGLNMYNWMNIFEDQRIETVLSTFFHRVDFPAYVKKVNGYIPGLPPKSPMELYYKIVRYGEGPKHFVCRRDELIKQFAGLTKRTGGSDVLFYFNTIKEFYNEIVKEYKEPEEKELSGESPDNKEKNEGAPGGGGTSETSPKTESKPGESEKKEGEAIAKENDGTLELTKEELDEIMAVLKEGLEKTLDQYENKELTAKIKTMIENAQRKKKNQASAITAYSGKLNPKLIRRPGKVETYKWWQKSSVNGDSKRFDKIQINLFCDVSGSFDGSTQKINELIKALIKIEKQNKDFNFKLIKMGDTNRIADKVNRQVRCREGNWLTNDILDIYKRVQTPDTTCYNVVVFDGDAQSFDGCGGSSRRHDLRAKHAKAFSAWNHPNCTIISDPENERSFNKWSPNAKRIYTYNYTAELEDNIIKSLGLLLK